MGKDSRFDQMRKGFARIARFWALQTGSILVLALPIIFIFEHQEIPVYNSYYAGAGIWLLGWLIETIADIQKFNFRQKKSNEGLFIQSGLWRLVQHPNYTGEILCWIGVFVITIPSL